MLASTMSPSLWHHQSGDMNLWTTSTQPTPPGPGSPIVQVSQTGPILLWETLALTGVDAAAWALIQLSFLLVLSRAPCLPPTLPLHQSQLCLSCRTRSPVQTLSNVAGWSVAGGYARGASSLWGRELPWSSIPWSSAFTLVASSVSAAGLTLGEGLSPELRSESGTDSSSVTPATAEPESVPPSPSDQNALQQIEEECTTEAASGITIISTT